MRLIICLVLCNVICHAKDSLVTFTNESDPPNTSRNSMRAVVLEEGRYLKKKKSRKESNAIEMPIKSTNIKKTTDSTVFAFKNTQSSSAHTAFGSSVQSVSVMQSTHGQDSPSSTLSGMMPLNFEGVRKSKNTSASSKSSKSGSKRSKSSSKKSKSRKTETPSAAPSISNAPSVSSAPSVAPSFSPSNAPSPSPSRSPTNTPTQSAPPSSQPSNAPSAAPTFCSSKSKSSRCSSGSKSGDSKSSSKSSDSGSSGQSSDSTRSSKSGMDRRRPMRVRRQRPRTNRRSNNT